MSHITAAGRFALVALAGIAAAVPVPPFEAAGEAASIAIAFTVFTLLAFLSPARAWPFPRVAVLLLGVVLSRVAAEATWELALRALPDSFYVLPRWLGVDGEGAYNLASYQVFVVLALIVGVLVTACWPNNSSKPTPLRGAA